MRNLIKFISLYSYAITFILLVFISVFFLVNENFVLKTKFLNSSNFISGNIYSLQSSIKDYFALDKKNKLLEKENKLLRENIIFKTDFEQSADSVYKNSYSLIRAEVINNSLRKDKNYITINKGRKDGIKEGMGVISNLGVVGKVKYVSNNFSTIISLLNTSHYVSSLVKETGTLSTINWSGKDPSILSLLYVPKHINIEVGNQIITSSFDSIYPKDIVIGEIVSVNKEVNSNFYQIEVISSQNFYNLSNVYVINYLMKDEKIKIEQRTNEE